MLTSTCQLSLTASTGLFLDAIYRAGLGKPTKDLSPDELVLLAKDTLFTLVTFFLGSGLIKVSFAVLLLRFIKRRSLKIILGITTFAIVAITIFSFFFSLFTCDPISYAWAAYLDPYTIAIITGQVPTTKPLGKCISWHQDDNATYAHIAFSIFADFMLGFVIPFLILRNMNMNRRLKITTFIILAFGAVASVASIARLAYDVELTLDVSISATRLSFWTLAELSWCLIATSLSTLKPLANKLGIFQHPSERNPKPSYEDVEAAKGRTPPARRNADGTTVDESLDDWNREIAAHDKHTNSEVNEVKSVGGSSG